MPVVFRFGRFELRPAERALLSDGESLRLGGRAFDILLALVERRDRVVEFDELLDVVWPGLAVEENNLSVQISTLRKLLGASSIATVRGRGYRFTAPVRELATSHHSDQPELSESLEQRQAAPWRLECVLVGVELLGPTDSSVPTRGPMPDFAARVQGAAGAEARVVGATDHGLCLAFASAAEGARAALRLRARFSLPGQGTGESSVRLGLGVVASWADHAGSAATESTMHLACALAGLAGPDDLITTADVVTEFVPGVDGDVEDLGDITVDAATLRAYRLRPRSERAPVSPLLRSSAEDLKPSIAVLPFEHLLPQPGDDLMGEAIADEIITKLCGHAEFSVISGLSSRRLKRCGLAPMASAETLAARFLVTGTYRLAEGRLWVGVHLQDARTAAVLRSLQIDTTLSRAFEPAQSLGMEVAEEIGRAVFDHAVEQSRSRPLLELEAYSLLLGAIGLMHRAAAREFDRARAMLEHLMQRPGCAGVAAAWLAKWYVLRVVQGWSREASADAQQALDHVARSLADDSRDALALSIGGLVHAYLRKDLNAAGQMYEQAISANPSEPLAWLFSATRHAYLGHGREAADSGERALRLSPVDPMKYFFDSLAATATLANGDWERSVILSHQSLQANRTHASTWRTLAFALVMLDRMDEARAAVQQLRAIEPGFSVGRFRERFPGRDGPLAEPWAEALKVAGLPA